MVKQQVALQKLQKIGKKHRCISFLHVYLENCENEHLRTAAKLLLQLRYNYIPSNRGNMIGIHVRLSWFVLVKNDHYFAISNLFYHPEPTLGHWGRSSLPQPMVINLCNITNNVESQSLDKRFRGISKRELSYLRVTRYSTLPLFPIMHDMKIY